MPVIALIAVRHHLMVTCHPITKVLDMPMHLFSFAIVHLVMVNFQMTMKLVHFAFHHLEFMFGTMIIKFVVTLIMPIIVVFIPGGDSSVTEDQFAGHAHPRNHQSGIHKHVRGTHHVVPKPRIGGIS